MRNPNLNSKINHNEFWPDVYEKYKPYVEKIVFFKLNIPAEERKDVASEIMIRIYNNIHNYSAEYDFKSWITTIAINYCYGYYNSSKRKIPITEFDMSDITITKRREVVTPETILIEKDQISNFITLISKYKEVDFNILFLRYLEGYKYEDIASKLDITISKVKNIIHTTKTDIQNMAKRTFYN